MRFFLLILAAYLVFASGYVDCVDAVPSLETAKSLVERGRLDTNGPEIPGTFFGTGPSGQRYSLMGIAMPIAYVVPVSLGKWITSAPVWRIRFTHFFVSLVNCFITALLVTLAFQFLLWYGRPTGVATTLALLLGFGTLLFAYSKTSHREPLQALALFGSFVFLTETATNRFRHATLYAGIFAAVGFLTKEVFLVPLLPALLYALAQIPKTAEPRRRFFELAAPLLSGVAAWAMLQKFTWGGVFNTGFETAVTHPGGGGAWTTPFWSGVGMQWLSFDTGFFFHNPMLFLAVPYLVWKLCTRKLTTLDAMIVLAFFLQTIFYAKWYTPIGKEALGPRFLVTPLPLVLLLFRDVSFRHHFVGPLRYAAAVLVVWSLLLSFTSASVKMQQYWTLKARSASELTLPHWAANFIFFAHKVTGSEERYRLSQFGANSPHTVSLTDAETLVGLNFWWLHIRKAYAHQSGDDRLHTRVLRVDTNFPPKS